jgi:hypothetical protein
MISLVGGSLIQRHLGCFMLFVYVGIEYVFFIIILYAKANSHDMSPFVSSCTVCLPVTLLYTHSFPNFVFRSPSINTISLFGTLSTTVVNHHKTLLYLCLFYLLGCIYINGCYIVIHTCIYTFHGSISMSYRQQDVELVINTQIYKFTV